MNTPKYTSDRAIQILIALLKAHGIRKIIASPGTTHAVLVASVQNDPDFEVYSCVDERSAAYMACGMSQESGEPVMITCTEATASRNYYPGLTEAYYRKLPILVVTGFHSIESIGQLYPQSIDRSNRPNDTITYSVTITSINNNKDEWYVNRQINKAILELKRKGGGPVHINLQSSYMYQLSEDKLPMERIIERISYTDSFPELPKGRIAIVVGSHKKFSSILTDAIMKFCELHQAVLFGDHQCGYNGKALLNPSLVLAQKNYQPSFQSARLVIHIGEIGAPSISSQEVWRVSEDGEIRDTFKKLRYVFEMDEYSFFSHYNKGDKVDNTFFKECENEINEIESLIPDLPFSNAWIAQNTHGRFPKNSVVHFGILNSYRVWGYFSLPNGAEGHCNVGGYGIDGGLSTLIGSSFASPEKIHFGIFGDLAFFYDLNSLGNRHIGNNLRILLINNGKGQEFRNCIHPAYKLGEKADSYIAAAGHFGNKSNYLVRHFSEDLGFEYLSASSKEEYLSKVDLFTNPINSDKSIIFEVFIDGVNDSQALRILTSLKTMTTDAIKSKVKDFIHDVVGDKNIHKISKII